MSKLLTAAELYAAKEMVTVYHTPGPWTADGDVKGWWGGDQPGCMVRFWRGDIGSPIANCLSRDTGQEAAVANALLIHTAPEMLTLLKAILADIDNGKLIDREAVHMAIARAELRYSLYPVSR